MMVESPCVDICTLDEARLYCTGCLRTLDEIVLWRDLDDGQKGRVVEACARRRAELDRRRAGQRND